MVLHTHIHTHDHCQLTRCVRGAPTGTSLPPSLSLNSLAWRAGTPPARLRGFTALTRVTSPTKLKGGERGGSAAGGELPAAGAAQRRRSPGPPGPAALFDIARPKFTRAGGRAGGRPRSPQPRLRHPPRPRPLRRANPARPGPAGAVRSQRWRRAPETPPAPGNTATATPVSRGRRRGGATQPRCPRCPPPAPACGKEASRPATAPHPRGCASSSCPGRSRRSPTSPFAAAETAAPGRRLAAAARCSPREFSAPRGRSPAAPGRRRAVPPRRCPARRRRQRRRQRRPCSPPAAAPPAPRPPPPSRAPRRAPGGDASPRDSGAARPPRECPAREGRGAGAGAKAARRHLAAAPPPPLTTSVPRSPRSGLASSQRLPLPGLEAYSGVMETSVRT